MRTSTISCLVRAITAVLSLIFPLGLWAQGKVANANDSDRLFAAFAKHQALERTSPFRSLTWQFLGPTNIAGRANDIAIVDGPAGRRVVVAYSFGGIWTSDAAEQTQHPLFTNSADMSIHALAVAPAAPNVIWAGTDAGLYRSTDAGRTWNPRGLSGARTIWRIVVDPKDANVVYVAAQGPAFEDSKSGGLFKTVNGGRTWRRVLSRGPRVGVTDIVLDPRDSRTIYASTYQKLYTLGSMPVSAQPPDSNPNSVWKSNDAGESWTESASGLPASRFRGRIGLDVARSAPNVLYAVVDDYEPARPVRPGELTRVNTPVAAVFNDHLVFRSDDAGQSWRRVSEPGTIQTWGGVMGPNDDFNQIRVDPTDPNVVYALGVRLHVSRDGGKTWTRVLLDTGYHADLRRLWIDPANPKRLYLCTDGGVYVSSDAAKTWTHILAPTANIHAVSVDDASPFHLYAAVQDYASWVRTVSLDRGRNSLAPVAFDEAPGSEYTRHLFPQGHPDTVITNEESLVRVALPGTSERDRMNIQPKPAPGEAPFRPSGLVLEISSHNSATLYVGYQFVLRSRDLGAHWERISPDLTDNKLSIPFEPRRALQVITALAESPIDAGTLYAGTDDGHLWLTRNDGKSWSELTPHLPTRKQINSIVVSAHDPATVYITQASTMPQWSQDEIAEALVYKSANFGKTFHRISGSLPSATAYVIRESHDVPGLLVLGTRFGAYVSSNDGRSWNVLGGNLPDSAVMDIVIQQRDHIVIVATRGRGVWALDEIQVRNALRR